MAPSSSSKSSHKTSKSSSSKSSKSSKSSRSSDPSSASSDASSHPIPKASDVASLNKRSYIPHIRSAYAQVWPTMSFRYRSPCQELSIPRCGGNAFAPPTFHVAVGDPVDYALDLASSESARTGQALRVPFVCPAHENRPGGDWETGASGYEQRLCRRSTLPACLAHPEPSSQLPCNYPLPLEGGILSSYVVVFRGAHPMYPLWDEPSWSPLPVVSVSPVRKPKLKHSGTRYSLPNEREIAQTKIRAALRVCLYNGFRCVVVGDFGLGKDHRNPPQEMAEMWREVFLYDPDLRGQFDFVAFLFEHPYQSTTQIILDDIAKQELAHAEGKGKGKGKASSGHHHHHGSSSAGSGSAAGGARTDFEIFRAAFAVEEIQRVLREPDRRLSLGNLIS